MGVCEEIRPIKDYPGYFISDNGSTCFNCKNNLTENIFYEIVCLKKKGG